MRNLALAVGLLSFLFTDYPAKADAPITITFDSLPTYGQPDVQIYLSSLLGTGNEDYDGLEWSDSFYVLNSDYVSLDASSGYYYGAQSASAQTGNSLTNVAINDSDMNNTVTMTDPVVGDVFTLTSAYFWAAYDDNLTVYVTGTGPTSSYSTSFQVGPFSASLETFNWTGLTSLSFSSSGGTPDPSFDGHASENFVVDDLALNYPANEPPPPPPPSVPEPSAAILLVIMLGVVGCTLRMSSKA